jgi:hypothetical protein
MFERCTSLTTAPNTLPATTLTGYCYSNMFNGCTSLATAPELPAITLTNSCYQSMFYGCTSLATAPELPATTLSDNCYNSMFQGCTSLTTAPDLLALSFEGSCYQSMFYGCTSLNYIKCLADCQPHIGYSYELSNWTYNVAENGTFVKSSNVQIEPTRWQYGSDGIPVGWTVISE